jgi:glycerol-3-phosphate cytidylyltransferase
MSASEVGPESVRLADAAEVSAVYGPSPHPPERGVVGYAPGAYDTFHVGHLNLLRRARLQCDYLIAGVVSDEVARIQKGTPPVIDEHERVAVVASMDFVDDVVIERTTDKLATWEDVRFDVVFKGDDWKGSAKWTELEHEFARRGARLIYLPYSAHISSTLIRGLVNGEQ